MSDVDLDALLKNVNILVSLEPEDLGGSILAHINSAPKAEREEILYVGSKHFIDLGTIPVDIRDDFVSAISEAWQWLEREGLVAHRPISKGFILTRRGKRLKSRADVATFLASRALPESLLHPRLVQRVWSAVIRGDYETAIFQAFREVEIGVREAGRLPSFEVGVSLMRRAFDKTCGALTNLQEPEAEREALSHLFAGAIGRFKNPPSHRSVEYSLTEAAEALMLASFLLRVVDERAAAIRGAS